MAEVKNYGLKGVADDVQLGKAGGRLKYATDFLFTTDGSTLANAQAAAPTQDDHIATKQYVDGLASGLDPKQSSRVATTGALVIGAGAGEWGYAAGVLTNVTASTTTIDSVVLADDDRVLVKDQVDAKQNGIYTASLTAVGSATVLTRAEDQDGSPANEVSAGNFTFIEAGTTLSGSGWVTTGDGLLTLDTDDINWVQFSDSSAINAGVALTQNGQDFDLDYTGLSDVAIATGDFLAFGDLDDSDNIKKRSIGDILDDMDVVQLGAFSSSAFIVRTADDVYAERTIAVSGAGAEEGLVIVEGNGATGNPTIGLDIVGNTARSEAMAGTDSFLAYNLSATANEKFTFAEMIADLSIVTDPGAGLMVSDGAGSYSAATITAGGTGLEGISIANGATAPVVGIDIDSLTAQDTLLLTDTLMVSDQTNNLKATLQDVVDLVASAGSDNEISQLDSSVSVTDTGSDGQITFTTDNTVDLTITDDVIQVADGTAFKLPSGSVDNAVLYLAADGTVSHEAGFTYVAGTDTLSAVNIVGTDIQATTFDGGFTNTQVLFANASGEITESANLTFSGSQLAITGSVQATSDIVTSSGNIAATAGTITAGTNFIDAGLTDTALLIADGSGNIGSSALTYASDTLSIGNIDINGSTNTISSTDTNGNIVLAPNGTGEVVIGSSGAGQIVADDEESLTLSGGSSASANAAGDVILNGGDNSSTGDGGDVILQAGDSTSGTNGDIKLLDAAGNEIAEFVDTAIANAENHITVDAGAAGDGPSISTDSTGATDSNIDLGFVLKGTGVLKVTSGSGDYETNVTADDDIPNKKYVDDAISGATNPGAIGSITATISLSAGATQAIGSIPAGATILRTYVDVTAVSTAATTVDIGDSTNGVDSYMTDAEIDAELAETFISDSFVTTVGAVTANATVATFGASGSADVVIEYRNA